MTTSVEDMNSDIIDTTDRTEAEAASRREDDLPAGMLASPTRTRL